MLPERINDTYLKYADIISFFYRKEVDQEAALAAVWLRNPAGSEKPGTLRIYDNDLYERIKSVHNEALKQSKTPDLLWEDTVEASSVISRIADK